ncbi:catenin delta-2 isoform X24 [Panulirus ornatus]|uniref:catenin delta-2 isoform X24 n=1 Tax=Panulirus ornatus TaxID=150431 RepID=UPI003A88898C
MVHDLNCYFLNSSLKKAGRVALLPIDVLRWPRRAPGEYTVVALPEPPTMTDTLLVNRKVEQKQEQTVKRTEVTAQRVLDKERTTKNNSNVGEPEVTTTTTTYSVDYGPHTTNGHHHDSPDTSRHSVSSSGQDSTQLVSRKQTQHTTQQITTTTKVIRELHHIGPDGEVLDSYQVGDYNPYGQAPPQPGYAMDSYRPHSPASEAGSRSRYEGYPPTSNAGYEYDPYSRGPPAHQDYPYDQVGYPPQTQPGYSGHYRDAAVGGYPQSGYAELDGTLLPPNGEDPYRNTPSPGMQGIPQDRYVRWRDPDLHEVIDFLSNPNNVVKANAAAYLQHLCYMDDPTKQKTRILGGIPPLVALLTHDLPELHRNACGALRNLSYGRQNDENKRAIKDAQGIPALVRLLRKTPDNEIKELVTGILWNLSSCEDLKHSIIDDALTVIVSHVIIPCSGWDGGEVERDPNVDVWWSTVFKNASGVLRNVSSAGEYARTKLRQCHGLVDSLLTVIKSAIQGSSHDNKSVENCVCILRNLSYRCQEVEDPNYDKNQPPTQSRAAATAKDGEGEGTDTCGRSSEPKDNLCDNLGCFGGSRKKKEAVGGAVKETSAGQRSAGPRTEPLRGMELLWQPEVVVGPYLALLSDCSNPETLEAAAGALQNLAACYWQPSIDVRAAVRKEKGLPILVELLRMEVDRVVCAVATALRNLAIDQRNKELIGKYAMRDLVQKLPSGNTHDSGTSDETIAAVLATLNEVIKKSAEFSRSLLDVGGVERLVNMTRHRGRYSVRVVKFASQVLFSMWGHQELREVYKKAGWKEQDFVSKSVAARNATPGGANSPTANNTLNRPMASQGGTRYEDRTIQRGQAKSHQRYAQGQEVPMADMGYGSSGGMVPPAGGVRLYPPVQGKPGEPVYAKVNRDKKRNRQYDGLGPQYGSLGGADDWGGPVYSGSPTSSPNFNNSSSVNNNNSNTSNNNGVLLDKADGQAGDSWV